MTGTGEVVAWCEGGYIGVHDVKPDADHAYCPRCGHKVKVNRVSGRFNRHKPPRVLRGTWDDPAIIRDSRIDHEDPVVRHCAERLHANESMHLHQYISSPICPYCALRASRVLR